MRPTVLLTILTFLVCSCDDAGQGKVQSTDTLKTNLSSTKNLATTSKGDSNTTSKSDSNTISKSNLNTINKTTLPLDTLSNIAFSKMTLISSGQMSPYTTVEIDGCNFDLVTNDNDTIYLATNDKQFQTPEGYKVGTNFSELPKDTQRELTKEPGWGYYYKLPSEWTLGFCEGNSCTDNYPQDSSKVKWIFKRK